jgi:hypothetical protein
MCQKYRVWVNERDDVAWTPPPHNALMLIIVAADARTHHHKGLPLAKR